MNATDNSESNPEPETIGAESDNIVGAKPEKKPKKPKGKFIDCKVCTHPISKSADVCPQCGHTNKWKKWLVRGGFVSAAFLFLIYHEPIIETFKLPEMVDMILHHLLGIPMDEGHH